MKKSRKKSNNSSRNTWLSALGVASGAIAAGAYLLLKEDKKTSKSFFSKKSKQNSIKDLQNIVAKSKTSVEDILKKMNTEVSKVSSNGKAKVEKMF